MRVPPPVRRTGGGGGDQTRRWRRLAMVAFLLASFLLGSAIGFAGWPGMPPEHMSDAVLAPL